MFLSRSQNILVCNKQECDVGLQGKDMIRELNEKEKAMMKHMRKNGRITSGEVQRMLEVSRGTANKYLTKLLSLKLIERLGEGKSTFYVLR